MGTNITSPLLQPNSDSIFVDAEINTFLNNGNDLEINTGGNGGSEGNILVQENANITWFTDASLTLIADRDIEIEQNVDLQSFGFGNLTLDAGGQILSNSDVSLSGGDLTLEATGNVNVQNLFTGSEEGNSGNITVQSTSGAIKTGIIDTSASFADAGSVNLTATGDIEVESINASSFNGNGGTIDISTAGFFRATDTSFLSDSGEEFSLTTASETFLEGQGNPLPFPTDDPTFGDFPFNPLPLEMLEPLVSGGIRIQHGGQGETPFIVGDATTNGTKGSIISGAITSTFGMDFESIQSEGGNRIVPTESYLDSYTQGDIEIITTIPEPTIPEPTITPTTTIPAPPECFPDCAKEKKDRSIPTATEEDEIEGENPRDTLKLIEEETGEKPAILYVYTETNHNLAAAGSGAANDNGANKNLNTKNLDTKSNGKPEIPYGETQWEYSGDRLSDYLNNATYNFLHPRANLDNEAILTLVLVTPDGEMFRRRVNGVTRRDLMIQAQEFMRGVSNPLGRTSYLQPAQYLYDAIIRPVEAILNTKEIDNISFILDDGLRTLPVAALHDGEQFLVEKYSLGLMPSFSLTNTVGYLPPKDNQLLAFGASTFEDQTDLPAAPLEVEIITKEIWQGGTSTFLDQGFTVDNLVSARERNAYGIVHLATHGEFTGSGSSTSYIQFQDQKVTLDQLDTLHLGDPPIELLVLSACRTAIGDRGAELGFAGLALNSGAKAAIGSIWYVSDVGTMGLMAKFYDELQRSPTKAHALQQAQIALLNKQVSIEDYNLRLGDRLIPLPDEIRGLRNVDLSHPYYWSGFTLVGNPW